MNFRKNFSKINRVINKDIQREKMAGLFGVSGDSAEDVDNKVKKQIEGARNKVEGKEGQAEIESSKLYCDDNSNGVFYKWIGKKDASFPDCPENERTKPANDVLVGRMTKSKMPDLFTYKGWIWEKVKK